MLFRLVRPVRRSGSIIPQFVQRIPREVHARLVGGTLSIPLGSDVVKIRIGPTTASIRFSLRTRDPIEAKIRQASVAAHLERVWRAFREPDAIALTQRQATALAGDVYRAWANGEGREQTTAIEWTPDGWVPAGVTPEEEKAFFKSAVRTLNKIAETDSPAVLERTYGPLLDKLLMQKGIVRLDPDSRIVVLKAVHKALRDAFKLRKRNADGDYTPDPKANRFSEWTQPSTPSSHPSPTSQKSSLKGLVEDWWKEAKATDRKPSTYESYRNTMANFTAFLKHDDARRVTSTDVIAFKDHRLASTNPRTGKRISAKTVKDSDLAGLKTIFGWAVSNGRMEANPAAGITIKLGKPQKLRSKGFTDAEASAILQAATNHLKGNEKPQTFAAKRWVPWLCAYTGARVGELAQLRKEDVRQEGMHWVIRITPEAGTVKTNEARDVVLHPHLIEQGFIRFVQDSDDGHLFLRPGKDGDVLGPLQGIKNRLAEFARAIVPDPNVAPNHGWRHRFKTIGLEAGIDHRVLDAIQGQTARSVSETYGDVTIRTIAAAMAKIPWMSKIA